MTDGNGSTVATYEYDVFGAVRGTTGTANGLFKYTGQQLDSDTGMYYLRARYYDPSVGRFLSKDPIGFAGGWRVWSRCRKAGSCWGGTKPSRMNLYAYAGNDPANYTDPSGLCQDPGGGGIRYCIEAYIPQATIGLGPVWFSADGRGPRSDGGTYRIHQQLKEGLRGFVEDDEPENSRLVGSFPRTGYIGPCGMKLVPDRLGASGAGINLYCSGSNGWGFGIAPRISWDLTIHDPDEAGNEVTVNHVSGFPALEVWEYGGAKGPRLIYDHPADPLGVLALDWFLPPDPSIPVPVPAPRPEP